jgi:putative membrane protein
MMWGHGWMGAGMMWVYLLLIVAVVVAVVALLIAVLGRPHLPEPGNQSGSATDVLARRFARGEIDQSTYEHMRERLSARVSNE